MKGITAYGVRNTSTYVEKIGMKAIQRDGMEKHLHIRGENHLL